MAGSKLLDSLVERASSESVSVVQPFMKRREIGCRNLADQAVDGLDLGREEQPLAVDPVIERFDPEAISDEPQSLLRPVIDAEGEDAVQPDERRGTQRVERSQNHLCIGSGAKIR